MARSAAQHDARRRETALRVRAVLQLLERRLYVSDVVRLTAEKYGVTPTHARRLVKLAKAELVLSTGLTRREHRALSLAFYGRVVREAFHPAADASGPPVTVRDALAAQMCIDKLLGLPVERDRELDALKATLKGLIAVLEPHAASARAPLPAPPDDAPGLAGGAP